MTPDEYCKDKAARSGSSFYYSFLFLPPEERQAITALYAFCREVDDIVDEAREPTVAAAKLDWWRGEVAALFSGSAHHPVAIALQGAVARYRLPRELFEEIIAGMEMDLKQNRYPDFESLRLYCYRVASVVGELSARIFGYSDDKTVDYAHDLGIALQLTNIVRDVGEDARRQRIYLPQDEMRRFGVENSQILEGTGGGNFLHLMAFQIERAENYYQKALAQLPQADRKTQRVGLIMAAIYHRILNKIEKDPEAVLEKRVSITPIAKLWLAWTTWMNP